MAFLDNSGDIILDAILTPEGRRRLARGGRGGTIVKFSFGDDEIDYALYNKNHASGSAYYDIEIMQTPILEAFGTSGLQYQLMSLSRSDLFYLPEILTNEKLEDSANQYLGVYYLATNTETRNRLVEIIDEKYVIQSNQSNRRGIILQSGLSTTDIPNTQAQQSAVLRNNNLIDSSFSVQADNRFIGGVMQQAANARVASHSDGMSNINFGSLRQVAATSQAANLSNYNNYNVRGVPVQIYYNSQNDYKNMIEGSGGPQGTMCMLNFVVDPTLTSTTSAPTPEKFSNFGKTAQTLFAGYTDTFDIIDTPVTVMGDATGMQNSFTVRIIRGASLN